MNLLLDKSFLLKVEWFDSTIMQTYIRLYYLRDIYIYIDYQFDFVQENNCI